MNYKKKNGKRKRNKLHGFRNMFTFNGKSGWSRINGLIRRHIRQSSKAPED